MAVPIVLTIAGSDSSGGAGIQADLKAIAACRCYGASVLTALTAQNTQGVTAVHWPPTEFIIAQLDAVLDDLDVRAIKVGMLGEAALIAAVAERLAKLTAASASIPVVVDPVMVATTGARLLPPEAIDTLKSRLIPLAALITPNIPEAAVLLQWPVERVERDGRAAAEALAKLTAATVLLKGGHGHGKMCVDILMSRDGEFIGEFAAPRVPSRHTHGSGCTLSSAIAANLARGNTLSDAIAASKSYVTRAIESAAELGVGHGHGPLNHFVELWPGP